eukprot:gene4709-5330_t
MKLLDKLRTNYRDTAREVARNISALANDSDDNGVLTGNWSGDYDTGVKPWKWTGSASICKHYLEAGKPVHYGQCWVFSGLTTALMRSLGIPTRSVTNYDSAHDTDNNLTFDKYFDEDGEYLDEESDDSCWNFHVWNESWMTRPDLPVGYGGWQAFDSTPQEESSGKYRCGPASVRAIKEGKVNLKYDAKFIFAEVNADKVYWKFNKELNDFEPFKVDTDAVGHYISTKAVGWGGLFSQREDVTLEYKYPEGSILERIAVRRAMKIAKSKALKEFPQVIRFSLEEPEEVARGDNVVVNLKMKNTSDKSQSVDISLTSQIVRYTGVALKKLRTRKDTVEIAAKKESEVKFTFEPSEYSAFMDENPMLRFTFMARVKSGQTFANQASVSINKPDLSVSLVSTAKKPKVKPGDTVTVKVQLDVPNDIKKLTGCALTFDGSAVASDVTVAIPNITSRKWSVDMPVEIKKTIKGRNVLQLIVSLSANEISGLLGTLTIELAKPAK